MDENYGGRLFCFVYPPDEEIKKKKVRKYRLKKAGIHYTIIKKRGDTA